MRSEQLQLPRLANVSVNLEPLANATAKDAQLQLLPYTVALPRMIELFDRLQIRVTFFVAGKELQNNTIAEALRDAASRGHEIASYTHSFAQNLRTWSKLSVAEEIEDSAAAIATAIGKRPQGFRTPGYNVDTRILQLLAERGFKYDASVLPSLPYFLKAEASTLMATVLGKTAQNNEVPAHSVRAPTQPYRPSRWAFWEPGNRKHSLPIWEIPIGVIKATGIPVTGETIAKTPAKMLPLLYKGFQNGQQTLHLELRSLDFLDREDTRISAEIVAKYPGLKKPARQKMEKLQEFIRWMDRDYRMATLEELADELEQAAGPTVVA